MKTTTDDLISRLQTEILFLQELNDNENMENYKYVLNGDLSESRTM